MSTTYEVDTGDTFETIARKQYGSEEFAPNVAKANPGVMEPLTSGTSLVTPALPGAPVDKPQEAPAQGVNEVAIFIDDKRFRFWDAVRIIRALDTMDTVEFSAPMESTLPFFTQSFRPFSFKPIVITVDGDPLFNGTGVGVTPVLQSDRKLISVSGYSLPGVLNDCTAPASAYPLEFNGLGLRDIANTLAALFGLSVVFDVDQGDVFDRVALEPGKRVFTFLAELARQRNLIIASTSAGELIFWQSIDAGQPRAELAQGESPVISITPFFSPQEFYSHVTGIEPVIIGLAGSQFTVQNPRLKGVVRPMTFEAEDTLEASLKSAVEAKAGRMFGNMVSYELRLNTWRDLIGRLWEPNTTIILQAPDAMIFNPYEFVIRSVDFNRNPKIETATLNLVIPGSFNGVIPETLPWDL